MRNATQRAAIAETQLRADRLIIETLAEPLLILGPDLKLRRANQAALREFGPEAPAILRHPALRVALDLTLAKGTSQTAEISLPVPVPRELQVSISLLDPEPGGDRILILLSDRTQERVLERMRSDFVANASHELRTPLASLIGFIETLRGPAANDPAAQQRFLAIMADQASRMHRLIDDLLSLSRIEIVEHQRPSERVDLGDLAGRVVASFEPAVAARGATLEMTIGSDLKPVLGDADQLTQVLQNLVDNALKYGGRGVHVRLSVAEAEQRAPWPTRPGVLLAVSDTGPGIPPEHLPRLTERFYRVDAGRSRAGGGTGLGLAIVKHITNRHRGQLWIDSNEGRGTSFSIWLPTT